MWLWRGTDRTGTLEHSYSSTKLIYSPFSIHFLPPPACQPTLPTASYLSPLLWLTSLTASHPPSLPPSHPSTPLPAYLREYGIYMTPFLYMPLCSLTCMWRTGLGLVGGQQGEISAPLLEGAGRHSPFCSLAAWRGSDSGMALLGMCFCGGGGLPGSLMK